MKKIIKIVLGIIGFILILAIGIVIYLFASLHDNRDNSNKEIINSNPSTIELLNEYSYDALKDTTNSVSIKYLLNENELNYLLASFMSSIDIENLKVKSIYSVYNENDTVSLYAPCNYLGFDTLLSTTLKIEKNDELNITLYDLKLGKLGINNIFLKSFLFNN